MGDMLWKKQPSCKKDEVKNAQATDYGVSTKRHDIKTCFFISIDFLSTELLACYHILCACNVKTMVETNSTNILYSFVMKYLHSFIYLLNIHLAENYRFNF